MKLPIVFLIVVMLATQGFCVENAKTVGDAYPYLCSGALKDAVLSRIPGQTVASSGSIRLTQKDIDAAIAEYPVYQRDQAKQYPVHVVEKTVSEKLIAKEAEAWAKKSGRSPSDPSVVDAYLTAQTPGQTVTDAEVQAFYKENAAVFGGAAFEQVKDVVKIVMLDEKTTEARDQFVNSAGKRHKILISSDWVKAQNEKWSANPVEKARVSGKPALVVFSVIGCCDKMYPILGVFSVKYADKLNAVFVNTREQTILPQLYGVSTIPVELIFDAAGKEVFRNKGFMAEDIIVAQFKAHGIELDTGSN